MEPPAATVISRRFHREAKFGSCWNSSRKINGLEEHLGAAARPESCLVIATFQVSSTMPELVTRK